MRKICAWCGKELDPPAGSLPTDPLVSHGICERCFSFLAQTDRRSISTFLNSFMIPVFLVDKQRTVIMANESAWWVFPGVAREPRDQDLVPVGTMIECVYARLHEGRGRTTHCAACQVRSSGYPRVSDRAAPGGSGSLLRPL